MQIFIDLDARQPIASPGDRSALQPVSASTQDTLELDVYFVRGGQYVDPGVGVALKFGVFQSPASTSSTPVALLTAFTRTADANGNYYWMGLLNLNTTQMATAIGSASSLACISEFRYQLPDGELIHTLFTQFNIFPAILSETSGSSVTIPTTYPDVSQIELVTHKGAASGYAALDTSLLVPTAELPIDGQTIVVATGKIAVPIDGTSLRIASSKVAVAIDGQTIALGSNGLALTSILGSFTANWTTVAANADTPSLAVASTTGLIVTSTVRIPVAGYYKIKTVVDGTHVVLTNNGDVMNAVAGVTITLGAVLLPAQTVAASAGITALTDAETTSGVSLVGTSVGSVKRLIGGSNVALDSSSTPGGVIVNVGGTSIVDAETTTGVTLLGTAANSIKRLIAGANVTLDTSTTPGGVIVNGSGGGGGVASLTDAETTTGVTLIGSSGGQVKRLVAGANTTLDTGTTAGAVIINSAGGSGGGITALSNATTTGTSVINDTSGVLKRLTSSDSSVTITDNTTSVDLKTAGGGGGSGGPDYLDPENGIEVFDNFTGYFSYFTENVQQGSGGNYSNWMLGPIGSGAGSPGNSMNNPSFALCGGAEMRQATNGTLTLRYDGYLSSGNGWGYPAWPQGTMPIGQGILTMKLKWALSALSTSTDKEVHYPMGAIALDQYNAAQPASTGNLFGGLYFCYNSAISANFLAAVSTGNFGSTTPNWTTVDTGVAVAAMTWYSLKIVTDATWGSIKYYINKTLVATITSGNLPTSTTDKGFYPVISYKARTLASSTSAALFTFFTSFFLRYQFDAS